MKKGVPESLKTGRKRGNPMKTNNQTFALALQLTKTIKPRQKAAFFEECKKANDKNEVFAIAKNFILSMKLPSMVEWKDDFFPVTNEVKKQAIYNLFACGECARKMASAKTWEEYIISYATFKASTYVNLNDLGAYADTVETVCHLLVCRESWRVNLKNLHVSAIGKIDLRFNGKKIEVGTNGKSWLESTQGDAMNGQFDSVIYGVFTEEEKETICEYFTNGQAKRAIKEIAEMLYYFEEKEQFENFINNISRSPSLVWKKAGYYQTVYNPSKHNAFIEKIEKSDFPSFLQIVGKNDFTE